MARARAWTRSWLTVVCTLGTGALFACSDADSGSKPAQEKQSSAADSRKDKAPEPDAPPIRGVTEMGLFDVWGSAADDVWAVGSEGAILHWDGKMLEVVGSTTTRSLHAVGGTGPDDIWATGDEGTTLHWDGRRFEFVQRWESETYLGIKALAPDNVWIVGVVPADRSGIVRHYDGASWRASEVPGSNSLWDVWCSSPNDVWFVGTNPNQAGVVYRGNGSDFDRVEFDGKPLRSIWGAGPEDVWLQPYDSSPQHWDGSALTVEEAEGDDERGMLGTWGAAPDDVWSVGLHGKIKHWDGEIWTVLEPLLDQPLWSVWGNSSDDVWAVGGAGAILRWNGDHWRIFATGEPETSATPVLGVPPS